MILLPSFGNGVHRHFLNTFVIPYGFDKIEY